MELVSRGCMNGCPHPLQPNDRLREDTSGVQHAPTPPALGCVMMPCLQYAAMFLEESEPSIGLQTKTAGCVYSVSELEVVLLLVELVLVVVALLPSCMSCACLYAGPTVTRTRCVLQVRHPGGRVLLRNGGPVPYGPVQPGGVHPVGL